MFCAKDGDGAILGMLPRTQAFLLCGRMPVVIACVGERKNRGGLNVPEVLSFNVCRRDLIARRCAGLCRYVLAKRKLDGVWNGR
jgi:hypothetical protein